MTAASKPTHARQIDLLAGDFYVTDPYPTYGWMRDNAPVYWDPINELWGISRYDDVVHIEKHKALFINSDQEKGGYRPNLPADPAIIGLDDPHHSQRRNLVSRRFTPRAVTSFEEHIREVVKRLFDDALGHGGPVDVVSELAAPLPAEMIGMLLGFPAEMTPKLQEWSERSIALGGGPQYMNDEGVVAVMEFAGASAELYEEKKKCPADDVMSVWTTAEVPGHEFGLDQVISDCLLLLDGGAETTRTVLARIMLELADRPEQWALLRNGADLDVAVEEFIRWVTPIHNMCRVATEDVEIAGQDDPCRRTGRVDVPGCEPRPGTLRGPREPRCHATPEPSPGLRFRNPLLPGVFPGPPRDQDLLRGAAQPGDGPRGGPRVGDGDAQRLRVRSQLRPHGVDWLIGRFSGSWR